MKRLALIYIILHLALSLFGENNKVDAKYVVTFYAKYSDFHNECPSHIKIENHLCLDKDLESNSCNPEEFTLTTSGESEDTCDISIDITKCLIRLGTYISEYGNNISDIENPITYVNTIIPIKPCDSHRIATGFIRSRISNSDKKTLFKVDYYLDIKPKEIEYIVNEDSNEDDVILYDETTRISATKGFPNDVYKWEYSYLDAKGTPRTGVLKPFKTEDNGATIYVKGSDFLSETQFNELVETQNGITINIDKAKPVSSNKRYLYARPKAPHITDVTLNKPTCAKDSATINISFSRNTLKNENIVIQYNSLTTGKNDEDIITTKGIKIFKSKNLELDKWEVKIFHAKYMNHKGEYITLHSVGEGMQDTINVTAPDPLSLKTKNSVNTRCIGDSNGEISYHVTGGTGSKTYTLSSNNTQIESITQDSSEVCTFKDLKAGTYYISTTDANGCESENKEEITIGEPTPVTLSASVDSNPKCQGSYDGVIKYNASGGTGNIKCYLQNFAHEVKDSTYSNSFSGLSAGAYYLSAKDNNSCFSDTISTFISEPEALSLSLETKNNTKKGGKSGELFATFGGGTEPYILDYAFGKTDAISEKIDTLLSKTLPAVDTLVVLSDKNGCITSKEFSITEPDSLKAVVRQVDFIKCYGDSTASLEIESITGGTPPYYIKWSHFDLNLEDKYKIDNLPASSYMLKVKTGYQDSIFISVDIDEPSKIKLLPSVRNTACVGEASGSILLNANGGTAPYKFSLNEQYSTNGEYNQLGIGSYNVSVEDENGCTTDSIVEIKTLSDINLNVTSSSPSCYNINNGTISISIDNGVRPYYVRCTDDSFLQVENNLELTNLEAGNYNIEVKDALGCIKTAEAILIKPEEFSFELPEKIYLCNEQSKDINIESERVTNVDWYLNNDLIYTGLNNKLTQEGVYRLDFLYDEQCHSFGEIEVDTINKKVDANFLVAAEIPINDDAHLINITPKENYEYVEWVYPTDDAWVYGEDEHSFQLVFLNEGIYQVGMIAHNDKCTASLFKTIKTFTPSGNNASEDNTYHITELSIDKSPNNGKFISYVNLSAKTDVKLYLYNASTGHIIATKEVSGEKSYEIPFSVNATAGEYILLAVAPQWQKSQWIKMIIK